MSAFRDIYIPFGTIGFPFAAGPRWNTTINTPSSGRSQRNQNWEHPQTRYDIPEAVRDAETANAVRAHWLAMRGPLYTFPLRDPLDAASLPMTAPNVYPVTSGMDCFLGLGDGVTTSFQLTKEYMVQGDSDSETYTRKIYLPVVDTIAVTINGADAAGTFDVERQGGAITFDTAPAPGASLRWGGLFDVCVRFEADDSFDAAMKSYRIAGFANMTFIEEKLC